jgi:hypothetical protein
MELSRLGNQSQYHLCQQMGSSLSLNKAASLRHPLTRAVLTSAIGR